MTHEELDNKISRDITVIYTLNSINKSYDLLSGIKEISNKYIRNKELLNRVYENEIYLTNLRIYELHKLIMKKYSHELRLNKFKFSKDFKKSIKYAGRFMNNAIAHLNEFFL